MSKSKAKKNLAVPGKPMSQKEFKALIKEAEEGPFHSHENFVEDIKTLWRSRHESNTETSISDLEIPLSKKQLMASIKKAEQGPFYTHDEFIQKFNEWKKTLKK